MRRHKWDAPEHDYCRKCKEDFSSPEEYLYHKLKRPDVHFKACRICGDEFKSDGGLKLHIERVTYSVFQVTESTILTHDRFMASIRDCDASAA